MNQMKNWPNKYLQINIEEYKIDCLIQYEFMLNFNSKELLGIQVPDIKRSQYQPKPS